MRIVASHLAELLEYLWLIIRGDPDSGVTDRYLYRTICPPGFNPNPPPLRGELHCVGKKVEKDLFDLALVAHKLTETIVNAQIQPCNQKAAGTVKPTFIDLGTR